MLTKHNEGCFVFAFCQKVFGMFCVGEINHESFMITR